MAGRGEVGTLGALWITWILVGGGILWMFSFSLNAMVGVYAVAVPLFVASVGYGLRALWLDYQQARAVRARWYERHLICDRCNLPLQEPELGWLDALHCQCEIPLPLPPTGPRFIELGPTIGDPRKKISEATAEDLDAALNEVFGYRPRPRSR